MDKGALAILVVLTGWLVLDHLWHRWERFKDDRIDASFGSWRPSRGPGVQSPMVRIVSAPRIYDWDTDGV